MQSYQSNGKLMLTGEYLVLKGAQSLALPVRFGQNMIIDSNHDGCIRWSSAINNTPWVEAVFSLPGFEIISTNNHGVSQRLRQLLTAARELNPDFLRNSHGENVRSNIEFDAEWGLGSSSSLVSNIAYWANCDAFELNRMTFGGSGYDIACARANAPVLYQLQNNIPHYRTVTFDPPFKNQLYFVWLNRKQNTREGIAAFDKTGDYSSEVMKLNEISDKMLICDNMVKFMDLMAAHERIISDIIHIEPVKQRLFPDFPGGVKSLGAWGGDFVLAVSSFDDEATKKYFEKRGFNTLFKYHEIIISDSSDYCTFTH